MRKEMNNVDNLIAQRPLHKRLYLVDPDGFTIQFYHVHDFDGIVSIFFTHELNEAIALVGLSHPIFRHVNIHWEQKEN